MLSVGEILKEAGRIAAQAEEPPRPSPGMSQRADLLSRIAIAQARAGDVGGALGTAASADDSFYTPYALQYIAVAQAEGGDIPGALSTVALIPSHVSTRATTIGRVSVARLNAGDHAGGRRLLEQALHAAALVRDGNMKLASLSGIAEHQAEAGNVEVAVQIASGMTVEGWPKEAIEDWRAAALGAISYRLAEMGEGQRALELVASIPARSRRVRERKALVSSHLARILAGRGDGDVAALACKHVRENVSPKPGGRDKDATLVSIAGPLVEAGRQDEAFEFAGAIRGIPDKVHALTCIASSQRKVGNLAGALETLGRALVLATSIRHHGAKGEALAFIAVGQAEAGDVAAALGTTAGIRDAHCRNKALRDIAVAQVKAGAIRDALEIAGRIADDGDKADVLQDVAAALAQGGDISTALQTASLIADIVPRGRAITRIAEAEAKTGQAAEALEWASREEPGFVKASAFLGVAEGLLEIDRG
jgi:tetratricopeptide (TPR) repeat protein